MRVRSLYAAFDRYPSPKGAAVHIREFAATLFTFTGGGLLHVLGGDDLPRIQHETSPSGAPVDIVRFTAEIPNFFERVSAYGAHLTNIAEEHRDDLELVHVRDPWSAIPLIRAGVVDDTPFVFEVNGLPSIELPYTFPRLGERTLAKLRAAELECFAAADVIVTPSEVNRRRLVEAGAHLLAGH